MKRRFRWWLSAVLLYLVSAPIIFIFIGLSLYLIAFIWVVINNLGSTNISQAEEKNCPEDLQPRNAQ